MAITETDELTPDGELDDTTDGASDDGSVAAFLRSKREELSQQDVSELKLAVPGYEGALVVTYRYPEGGSDSVISAVNRAQNSKERDSVIHANADLLVACCHEIQARLPGGELEPLDPDPTQDRLRFNRRLAELLGIDVPAEVRHPARFVCRQVFSPQAAVAGVYDGDLALATQGGRVVQFLTKVDEEVSEQFVGE